MLFKIDENLPTDLAQLMVSSGHDAKTVYDQQLQDQEILFYDLAINRRRMFSMSFTRSCLLLSENPSKTICG
jgi:predicted nuclease of predicted toxin-antitoxin system